MNPVFENSAVLSSTGHDDYQLDMDGVLKSWAILSPDGRSLVGLPLEARKFHAPRTVENAFLGLREDKSPKDVVRE
jgi:hypothetical protein